MSFGTGGTDAGKWRILSAVRAARTVDGLRLQQHPDADRGNLPGDGSCARMLGQ